MRPGRLDRLVYVPLPDEHTREEILKLRLGSVPLADDVDIGELVKLTHRYSGAEVSIGIWSFTDRRNQRVACVFMTYVFTKFYPSFD